MNENKIGEGIKDEVEGKIKKEVWSTIVGALLGKTITLLLITTCFYYSLPYFGFVIFYWPSFFLLVGIIMLASTLKEHIK